MKEKGLAASFFRQRLFVWVHLSAGVTPLATEAEEDDFSAIVRQLELDPIEILASDVRGNMTNAKRTSQIVESSRFALIADRAAMASHPAEFVNARQESKDSSATRGCHGPRGVSDALPVEKCAPRVYFSGFLFENTPQEWIDLGSDSLPTSSGSIIQRLGFLISKVPSTIPKTRRRAFPSLTSMAVQNNGSNEFSSLILLLANSRNRGAYSL